jgi:hypothetical protein
MNRKAGPGRPKGLPNKRTVQKMIEASRQIADIKKKGQKKATEVLNDLMQTSMSFAARYQARIIAATDQQREPTADDLAHFWKAMECAGTFAKALAPFQDPTFKAIQVTMAPPAGQDMPLHESADNVVTIDDPVALARVYQRMVKRIA